MKYRLESPDGVARFVNAPQYTAGVYCRTGWGVKAWKVRYSEDWSEAWLEPCSLDEAQVHSGGRWAYDTRVVSRPCCSFCLEYPVSSDAGLFCSKVCADRNAKVSRWSDKTLRAA